MTVVKGVESSSRPKRKVCREKCRTEFVTKEKLAS